MNSAIDALHHLQERARGLDDIYDLERFDRAFDEIVAHLHRTDPAPFQARSALANAGKAIHRHRAIRRYHSLDERRSNGSLPDAGSHDGGFDVVEIMQWLDTTPCLSSVERGLLQALAHGCDVSDLAAQEQVPVARIRERIARARSKGRAAYHQEMLP